MTRLGTLFFLAIALGGCVIDPSLYPYNGPDGSVSWDASPGLDADAAADTSADATPDTNVEPDVTVDSDMSPPTGPQCQGGNCECTEADNKCTCAGKDKSCTVSCGGAYCDLKCQAGARCTLRGLADNAEVDCKGKDSSCESIQCVGACAVACDGRDTRCAVECATDERCELDCKKNPERCEILSCDDVKQCGDRLVCNGGC